MANFSKNIKPVINGFTLIELLVVIGILAIVITLLISVLDPLTQFRKSRDSRRKSDFREMKTSLMLYRNTCDNYPAHNVGTNKIEGCGTCASPTVCDWGSQWSVNGNVIIMKALPKDPSSPGQDYKYTQINNNEFKIATCLENRFDPSGQDSRDRCGATGLPSCNNEYVVCED